MIMKKIVFYIILTISYHSVGQQLISDFYTGAEVNNLFMNDEFMYWIKTHEVKNITATHTINDGSDIITRSEKFNFSKKGFLTEHEFFREIMDKTYEHKYIDTNGQNILMTNQIDVGGINHKSYTLSGKLIFDYAYSLDENNEIQFEAKKLDGDLFPYWYKTKSRSVLYDTLANVAQVIDFSNFGNNSNITILFDTMYYQKISRNNEENKISFDIWKRGYNIGSNISSSFHKAQQKCHLRQKIHCDSVIISDTVIIFDTVYYSNNFNQKSDFLDDISNSILNKHCATVFNPNNTESFNVVFNNEDTGFLKPYFEDYYATYQPSNEKGFVILDDSSRNSEVVFDFDSQFYTITVREKEANSLGKCEKKYVFTDTNYCDLRLFNYIQYDENGVQIAKYYVNKLTSKSNYTFDVNNLWYKEIYLYTNGVPSGKIHYEQKRKIRKNKIIEDPTKIKFKSVEIENYSSPKNIIYIGEGKNKVKIGDQIFTVQYWK